MQRVVYVNGKKPYKGSEVNRLFSSLYISLETRVVLFVNDYGHSIKFDHKYSILSTHRKCSFIVLSETG